MVFRNIQIFKVKKKFNINIYQILKKDFRNSLHTNTLRYILFPKDNAVTSSIINGWQYEKYMFDFLEINMIETLGKDIIDVGGNNGNFAIDFAHLAGDTGKVYSFEPQRLIFYQLCGNIFLNGIDNVYCHNVAVGNSHDKVFIGIPNHHETDEVNFGDVRVCDEGDLTNQVMLDDYEFNNLIFIKIDTQGYEEQVIRGATNTINKHRPYLFVEFEEDLLQVFKSSEQKLKENIESLGYVVRRFQDGIPYQTTSGKCLDCVCIPIEKFNEFNYIIP